MTDARAYTGFDAFIDRLRPDAPQGRDAAAAFGFSSQASVLEAAWDDVDAVLALLKALPQSDADRLRHHLARLTRLPQGRPVDLAELFAVKRFLHHHSSALALLDQATRDRFELRVEASSVAIADLLNRGRQSAETLYLADEYSPTLAAVRGQVRDVDARIAASASARLEEIKARYGLDLAGREFALVSADLVGPDAGAGVLSVEAYDAGRLLVRVLPGGEQLRLGEERERLAEAERSAEAAVVAALSDAVAAEQPRLAACAAAIGRFDLAFGRARLALETSSTRPELGPQTVIEAGRLPACEELCARLDTHYVPLDLVLDGRPLVIFGSNMGGKSVVLQTVGFLQWAAQSGLFVPATHYTVRLVERVVFVGDAGPTQPTAGLSGFGREVEQLTTVLQLPGRSLLLFDEFARTTGSSEAEALIGALVEHLVDADRGPALFATHFRGIPRCEGVRYARMRGLDAGLVGSPGSWAERIASINRHMDYTLTADEGVQRRSDALVIASALGLDPGLVARAAELLSKQG